MSLHTSSRFALRSRRHGSATSPLRQARLRLVHRPIVERLEDRCLLSLLGLSQLAQKPDIASGSRTTMS